MDEEILALVKRSQKKEKDPRGEGNDSTIINPSRPPHAQSIESSSISPSQQEEVSTTAISSGGFSSMMPFRLKSVKMSSDEVSKVIQERKILSISALGRARGNGLMNDDWALFGVLEKKSGLKRSANGGGGEFCVWTLSDLDNHSLPVYLFGAACNRGLNVSLGMVICLLTPKLLEQRNNSSVAAVIPISVSHGYQIIEIGFAGDFATCGMTDSRGLTCGKAFNLSRGRFCSQHSQLTTASKIVGNNTVQNRYMIDSAARGAMIKTSTLVRAPSLSGRTGGTLKMKIQSMVKKDQPHRNYRWSAPTTTTTATIPASNKRPLLKSKSPVSGQLQPTGKTGHTQLALKDKVEGLYTVETQRKDGSVIVPGPSKLFQKGANGVAYSNYVDGLEAARLNRERQIRETRIQKQEQVVKQAVQALHGGGRKSTRGAPALVLRPSAQMTTVGSSTRPLLKAITKEQQQQSTSVSEAEALIGRKSRHEAEAKNELVDQLAVVFDSLSEKENAADRLSSLSSIEVTAFRCTQCDRYFDKWPRLCSQQGHEVTKTKTKKRFFICINTNCGQCITTLGTKAVPKDSCSRCGKKDWRLKGRGSAAMQASQMEQQKGGSGGTRLIAAIAEHTRFDDFSDLYRE